MAIVGICGNLRDAKVFRSYRLPVKLFGKKKVKKKFLNMVYGTLCIKFRSLCGVTQTNRQTDIWANLEVTSPCARHLHSITGRELSL